MQKNKVALFLIVFLVFTPCFLFSSWKLGNYVDDFGDETGDHFIYTTAEGTFSNSATSSSFSPLRITLDISGDLPAAAITFEPHAYSWDNPVENFYNNSTATIKFKDDAGNVTTVTSSNSRYANNWNVIIQQDAVTIVNLFRKNKTLKISIKIESYTFNYTVDCSDFLKVYDSYYPSVKNGETGKWNISYSISDFNTYEFCSASIDFESTLRKKDIIGTYSITGYPANSSSFPSLSFDFIVIDSDSGLYYPSNTYPDSSKTVLFSKISFTVGEKNYTFTETLPSSYLYHRIKDDKSDNYINQTKLVDTLKSGQTLVIDLYTTEGDLLSFTTSAQEFLEKITDQYSSYTEKEAIEAAEKAALEEAREKRKALETSSTFTFSVGLEEIMTNKELDVSSPNFLLSVSFSKIIFRNGVVGCSADGSFGSMGKELGLSLKIGMEFKYFHFGLRYPVRFNLDNSDFGVVSPQIFIGGFIPFKIGGLEITFSVSVFSEVLSSKGSLSIGYSLKSKEGSFANWYYK